MTTYQHKDDILLADLTVRVPASGVQGLQHRRAAAGKRTRISELQRGTSGGKGDW